MFVASRPDEPLSQGDIFDDGPLVGLNLAVVPMDWNDPATKWWSARVIVLTQTCDLVQGKTDSVLVSSVHDAQSLVDRGVLKGSAIRDQIRRHLVFGWYFLPAATAPIALPESLVDLRDLHSVPRAALEQKIATGKRIGRLSSPFREHLAQHFAVTYMRIALPEPYSTHPATVTPQLIKGSTEALAHFYSLFVG